MARKHLPPQPFTMFAYSKTVLARFVLEGLEGPKPSLQDSFGAPPVRQESDASTPYDNRPPATTPEREHEVRLAWQDEAKELSEKLLKKIQEIEIKTSRENVTNETNNDHGNEVTVHGNEIITSTTITEVQCENTLSDYVNIPSDSTQKENHNGNVVVTVDSNDSNDQTTVSTTSNSQKQTSSSVEKPGGVFIYGNKFQKNKDKFKTLENTEQKSSSHNVSKTVTTETVTREYSNDNQTITTKTIINESHVDDNYAEQTDPQHQHTQNSQIIHYEETILQQPVITITSDSTGDLPNSTKQFGEEQIIEEKYVVSINSEHEEQEAAPAVANVAIINVADESLVDVMQASVAATGDIAVAVTEDMPVIVTGDVAVTVTEEMPVAATEDITVTVKEEMPVAISENIAVAVREEMPVAVTENVAAAIKEDMPYAATEDIAVAIKEDMPVVVTEDVAVAVKEDMPVAVTIDVAVAVKEDMPVAVTEDTAVAVTEDMPVAATENIAVAVREEMPVAVIQDEKDVKTVSTTQDVTASVIQNESVATTQDLVAGHLHGSPKVMINFDKTKDQIIDDDDLGNVDIQILRTKTPDHEIEVSSYPETFAAAQDLIAAATQGVTVASHLHGSPKVMINFDKTKDQIIDDDDLGNVDIQIMRTKEYDYEIEAASSYPETIAAAQDLIVAAVQDVRVAATQGVTVPVTQDKTVPVPQDEANAEADTVIPNDEYEEIKSLTETLIEQVTEDADKDDVVHVEDTTLKVTPAQTELQTEIHIDDIKTTVCLELESEPTDEPETLLVRERNGSVVIVDVPLKKVEDFSQEISANIIKESLNEPLLKSTSPPPPSTAATTSLSESHSVIVEGIEGSTYSVTEHQTVVVDGVTVTDTARSHTIEIANDDLMEKYNTYVERPDSVEITDVLGNITPMKCIVSEDVNKVIGVQDVESSVEMIVNTEEAGELKEPSIESGNGKMVIVSSSDVNEEVTNIPAPLEAVNNMNTEPLKEMPEESRKGMESPRDTNYHFHPDDDVDIDILPTLPEEPQQMVAVTQDETVAGHLHGSPKVMINFNKTKEQIIDDDDLGEVDIQILRTKEYEHETEAAPSSYPETTELTIMTTEKEIAGEVVIPIVKKDNTTLQSVDVNDDGESEAEDFEQLLNDIKGENKHLYSEEHLSGTDECHASEEHDSCRATTRDLLVEQLLIKMSKVKKMNQKKTNEITDMTRKKSFDVDFIINLMNRSPTPSSSQPITEENEVMYVQPMTRSEAYIEMNQMDDDRVCELAEIILKQYRSEYEPIEVEIIDPDSSDSYVVVKDSNKSDVEPISTINEGVEKEVREHTTESIPFQQLNKDDDSNVEITVNYTNGQSSETTNESSEMYPQMDIVTIDINLEPVASTVTHSVTVAGYNESNINKGDVKDTKSEEYVMENGISQNRRSLEFPIEMNTIEERMDVNTDGIICNQAIRGTVDVNAPDDIIDLEGSIMTVVDHIIHESSTDDEVVVSKEALIDEEIISPTQKVVDEDVVDIKLVDDVECIETVMTPVDVPDVEVEQKLVFDYNDEEVPISERILTPSEASSNELKGLLAELASDGQIEVDQQPAQVVCVSEFDIPSSDNITVSKADVDPDPSTVFTASPDHVNVQEYTVDEHKLDHSASLEAKGEDAVVLPEVGTNDTMRDTKVGIVVTSEEQVILPMEVVVINGTAPISEEHSVVLNNGYIKGKNPSHYYDTNAVQVPTIDDRMDDVRMGDVRMEETQTVVRREHRPSVEEMHGSESNENTVNLSVGNETRTNLTSSLIIVDDEERRKEEERRAFEEFDAQPASSMLSIFKALRGQMNSVETPAMTNEVVIDSHQVHEDQIMSTEEIQSKAGRGTTTIKNSTVAYVVGEEEEPKPSPSLSLLSIAQDDRRQKISIASDVSTGFGEALLEEMLSDGYRSCPESKASSVCGGIPEEEQVLKEVVMNEVHAAEDLASLPEEDSSTLPESSSDTSLNQVGNGKVKKRPTNRPNFRKLSSDSDTSTLSDKIRRSIEFDTKSKVDVEAERTISPVYEEDINSVIRRDLQTVNVVCITEPQHTVAASTVEPQNTIAAGTVVSEPQHTIAAGTVVSSSFQPDPLTPEPDELGEEKPLYIVCKDVHDTNITTNSISTSSRARSRSDDEISNPSREPSPANPMKHSPIIKLTSNLPTPSQQNQNQVPFIPTTDIKITHHEKRVMVQTQFFYEQSSDIVLEGTTTIEGTVNRDNMAPPANFQQIHNMRSIPTEELIVASNVQSQQVEPTIFPDEVASRAPGFDLNELPDVDTINFNMAHNNTQNFNGNNNRVINEHVNELMRAGPVDHMNHINQINHMNGIVKLGETASTWRDGNGMGSFDYENRSDTWSGDSEYAIPREQNVDLIIDNGRLVEQPDDQLYRDNYECIYLNPKQTVTLTSREVPKFQNIYIEMRSKGEIPIEADIDPYLSEIHFKDLDSKWHDQKLLSPIYTSHQEIIVDNSPKLPPTDHKVRPSSAVDVVDHGYPTSELMTNLNYGTSRSSPEVTFNKDVHESLQIFCDGLISGLFKGGEVSCEDVSQITDASETTIKINTDLKPIKEMTKEKTSKTENEKAPSRVFKCDEVMLRQELQETLQEGDTTT